MPGRPPTSRAAARRQIHAPEQGPELVKPARPSGPRPRAVELGDRQVPALPGPLGLMAPDLGERVSAVAGASECRPDGADEERVFGEHLRLTHVRPDRRDLPGDGPRGPEPRARRVLV